jgi:hypothetical protein
MVFGLMHHGLIEHFKDKKRFFPEYIIEDNESIITEFDSLGLNVVFTGHFHAQDIVKKQTGKNFMFDIETGSAITYPCPYRVVSLSANKTLDITTKKVTEINYDLQGKSFNDYAKNLILGRLYGSAIYMLTHKPYNLSKDQAENLAPLFSEAFLAVYAGDETPTKETLNPLNKLAKSTNTYEKFAASYLFSLWHDLPPKDNNIIIDLKDGTYLDK